MSNFREMTLVMAPEWLSEKIQTFKYEHVIYIYIALKHIIWRI